MFSKYICSYLKQKKIFFFRKSIIKKNKGGGDLVGEKCTFFGRQKFLADGVAGRSKNRPGANFGHIAHSTSRNFNFNEKQKSYASWKLCNAKKSKIMVAPLNVRIFQVSPEMNKFIVFFLPSISWSRKYFPYGFNLS